MSHVNMTVFGRDTVLGRECTRVPMRIPKRIQKQTSANTCKQMPHVRTPTEPTSNSTDQAAHCIIMVDTHIAPRASPPRALASPLNREYLPFTRASRSHTAARACLTLSPPLFALHQSPPDTLSHTDLWSCYVNDVYSSTVLCTRARTYVWAVCKTSA